MSNYWAKLSDMGVIDVSGQDANTFLQGQLSHDVMLLKKGDAQWSSLSSPKGRIIGFGALFCLSGHAYAWVLPKDRAKALTDYLKKYVLRAEVTIENNPIPEGLLGVISTDTVKPAKVKDVYAWRDSLPDDAAETTIEHYRHHYIGHCALPWINDASANQFTAHMLGLDALDVISFTKGCYVGQEIIARTEHLGTVKRRMRIFTPNTLPEHAKAVCEHTYNNNTTIQAVA